ncbi:protein adenylyltransferase SelO [Leucobacter sp. W1478]|uniref:protein adenylyltransferase SelO n=1 Tax=Leucobacter sp. W1478 TaxID=3439065 RepID=UPI003F315320
MEANLHEHEPSFDSTPKQEPEAEPSPEPQLEELPVFRGAALSAGFVAELPELALEWRAALAPDPQLLVLNDGLVRELRLDPDELRSTQGVNFLVGRALAPGSRPAAQLYSGHQFGSYSPVLGDGRALLLGEIHHEDGTLRDLHLKGSGRTPPARGDGFAAVGPMLREYLVSEAMHALGIPTTRALAVTATGRPVWRDDFRRNNQLPGAVLTRVAASHLRVGTFQYARATRNADLLQRLVGFAIHRHEPHLEGSEIPARELLREVTKRQASLVASWMLVGFVHGVMNTDNMTISGETIDYGPCAFIDAYDPQAVFSSIDHEGRYAFGNQRAVAKWNLARFAEALLPALIDGCGSEESAVAEANAVLAEFDVQFDAAWREGMRAKLGLTEARGVGDETVNQLASELLQHLQQARADYTGSFRALASVAASAQAEEPSVVDHRTAHGEVTRRPSRGALPASAEPATQFPVEWVARWLALGPDAEAMNRINPIYIPRNHLVDAALEAATDGELGAFAALLEHVTHPYDERPGGAEYASPAPRSAGRFVTYCGT